MEHVLIAGKDVQLNEEGYFTDPAQWTEEIAKAMAEEEGLELSEKHFEVLHYLRKTYAQGEPLTIRKVGKSGIVDIKQFYALFPGGPLKVSSKLAGIPKPVSCI